MEADGKRSLRVGSVVAFAAAALLVAFLVVAGRSQAEGASGASECGAATHAAIRFWHLPKRVHWGRRYVFGLKGEVGRVRGAIHVTMASPAGSEPFASSRIRRLSARLFVELDRGDAPARIAASHTEARRAGGVCRRVIAATIRGTSAEAALPHTYVAADCFHSHYRPAKLLIACGDGNLYVTGIRWRYWNRVGAIGRGVGHFNDCEPYCAAGHFHTQPIALRAYRPRYCAQSDRLEYTMLRYRFLGGGREPHTVRKVPHGCAQHQ